LLSELHRATSSKFDSGSDRLLGSFFFLRVVCPAIINPIAYGMMTAEKDFEIKRGLVIIAKMLQTLANGESSFSEEYMVPMQPFLQENACVMTEITRKLISSPESGGVDSTIAYLNMEEKIKCVTVILHELIQLHDNEDMQQALLQESQSCKRKQEAMDYLRELGGILTSCASHQSSVVRSLSEGSNKENVKPLEVTHSAGQEPVKRSVSDVG